MCGSEVRSHCQRAQKPKSQKEVHAMSMFTFYFRQSGDARKPFVKAVSEILEAKPRYLGMPSMAYGIDFATVTKEGNIELNDRTDSELVESAFAISTICRLPLERSRTMTEGSMSMRKRWKSSAAT